MATASIATAVSAHQVLYTRERRAAILRRSAHLAEMRRERRRLEDEGLVQPLRMKHGRLRFWNAEELALVALWQLSTGGSEFWARFIV